MNGKGFISLIYILFLCFVISAQPKSEIRAVWVATVDNIDWPSKQGLPVKTQKEEAVKILEQAKVHGMNAVIFQVRPSADAFYPSELEPWSKYLCGTPGQAPSPYYDPLKFWIEESHKRGLEFHAWLNPYRVAQRHNQALAGDHIAFKHPEWILKYGERLYFDPGIPQTRDFVCEVVKDIVKRYDVDAIHFDDYFYPYPRKEEFPDTLSFKKYNRGYASPLKADWRRENVDLLVKMLGDSIKKAKPWVKFGISPFGVWRNKTNDADGSDTRAGVTNYDDLYADVIKWQKEGWIDYILPQLYWRVGHPLVDFELLAHWWDQHAYGRAMYTGHALYKMDSLAKVPEWQDCNNLVQQIAITREIKGLGGSAFFSSRHFNRYLNGFQDSLKNRLYSKPALIPPMLWIDDTPPEPVSRQKKSGKKIKWKYEKNTKEMDKPRLFVVYMNEVGETFNSNNPEYIHAIVSEPEFKFKRINKKKKKYEVRVSAVDRMYNESSPGEAIIFKL